MNTLIKKALVLSLATMGMAPLVSAQNAVHETGLTANSFGVGIFYGYELNDQWAVRAQLNGIDFDDTDAEVSGLDYEGKGESSSFGIGVDWRPFAYGWAKKVYVSGGLISVEYDFNGDVKAKIGDTINVGGANIRADSINGLNADIDYDHKVTPYVGVGWRSKAASEAGLAFTVELGVLNLGDPSVTLTANDPDSVLSQTNLDTERDQIQNDLGGVSSYGSLGVSYRF